jgi:hypothetical protein
MSNNLPLEWDDKKNNPELLAFLQQYGAKEYLSAEEINQMRNAVNELFYKVLKSKIYENGDLQIFRKPGTIPNLNNSEPNVGDWCIGFVEDQFINAEFLGPNKKLLTSFNL